MLKSLKGNSGAKGSTGPTGVAGTAGTAGTAGAKGATGEQGPSHAYSAETYGDATELTATVHVPAGDYAVSGSGEAQVLNEPKDGSVYCVLLIGGTPFDEITATVPNSGEDEFGEKFGLASVANQKTEVLTSPGYVAESCEESFGLPGSEANVEVKHVAVTAIQVGALN